MTKRPISIRQRRGEAAPARESALRGVGTPPEPGLCRRGGAARLRILHISRLRTAMWGPSPRRAPALEVGRGSPRRRPRTGPKSHGCTFCPGRIRRLVNSLPPSASRRGSFGQHEPPARRAWATGVPAGPADCRRVEPLPPHAGARRGHGRSPGHHRPGDRGAGGRGRGPAVDAEESRPGNGCVIGPRASTAGRRTVGARARAAKRLRAGTVSGARARGYRLQDWNGPGRAERRRPRAPGADRRRRPRWALHS